MSFPVKTSICNDYNLKENIRNECTLITLYKYIRNKTFFFLLTSCLPNPVASPFVSPVRVTGRATGCHSYPNATAMMKCCFSLSWVYHLHLVACWKASVAPLTPWPHTGTGGSPRYTPLDPYSNTYTEALQISSCVCSIPSCFIDQLRFLSRKQGSSGSLVIPF